MEKWKVSIVGTGPGDVALLTVQAVDCLRNAGVVLYDCLPATNVLKEVRPGAEIIFADKFPENGEEAKDVVKLIEYYYHQGMKVVRLRAGDGMMFNGADVDARRLTALGIPFRIVPGITAACAASSIFAIPTTEIHKSNAIVHLIACEMEDAHIRHIAGLFRYGTTVALYMAYDNLEKIFALFREEGVRGDMPVVIASMVSLIDEDCAVTTMDQTLETMEKREMVSPFVFFIGCHVTAYLKPGNKMERFAAQKMASPPTGGYRVRDIKLKNGISDL